MTDLTRRNFLRGIVAAAGVAAVGLPTLPAIASEAPPPELPFPDHENGDLFIKVDGVWRFAGKVKSLDVAPVQLMNFAEILSNNSGYREFKASFTDQTVHLTSFYDEEGYALLAKAFGAMSNHELAISMHGDLLMFSACIRSMEISMPSTHAIEIEAAMSLLGPVTTTLSRCASVRDRNETDPKFHKKPNKFSDSQSTA